MSTLCSPPRTPFSSLPPQDPLFAFLESSTPGGKYGDIKWNFEKFLVGADGVPLHRYKTKETPLSFEEDIKKVIPAPLIVPWP